MATWLYSDYGQYEYTSPSTALARAQLHETELKDAIIGRGGSDTASYDPTPILAILDVVRKDIARLAMKANRAGVPRLVPTVRHDPLGSNVRSAY